MTTKQAEGHIAVEMPTPDYTRFNDTEIFSEFRIS